MAKVRVICGTDIEGTPFVIVGNIMGFPAEHFIEQVGANPSTADAAKLYAESITSSTNECCGILGPVGLVLGFLPFHIIREGYVDAAITDCAEVVTFDGEVDVDGWDETDGYIKGTLEMADDEDCQPTEL